MSEKDFIARSIFRNMNKDITKHIGIDIGVERNRALDKSFASFRDIPTISCDDSMGSSHMKYVAQLDGVFNKFIADSDANSQEDLDKKAITAFMETQAEVKAQCSTTLRAHLVYKEVRRIVTIILGKTVPLDLFEQGKFTEKASKFVPRAKGHLHCKLSKASCTGKQKDLFESLFGESFGPVNYALADEIDVVAVPKKFDKARTICPNTVIDGFLSDAVGKFIATRLKESVQIDIRRQQEKHRVIVKRASIDGRHTTLDLSKASDLFSIPFMRRVLPSSWYRLLSKTRMRRYNCDGRVVPALSFMSMGVGYTFPLQTLLFYAIIQAIKNLLFMFDNVRVPGIISVYGDDCIFPVGLTSYVMDILHELGFQVNYDKTFWTGKFRESCGCDCYNGVDVRPVMLKWDDDISILENLYKFYNRFFEKYHECEFPTLKKYLLSAMQMHTAEIHVVPWDYPHTSGVRVKTLSVNLENYFGAIRFSAPRYYPQLDLSNLDLDGPIDVEQIEMGWYFCCILPPKNKLEVIPRVEHWTYLQYALYCSEQKRRKYFNDFLLREQLHMFHRPRPVSLSRPVTTELHPEEIAMTQWTKFRFRGRKYSALKRKLKNIARSKAEFIQLLDSMQYGLQVPSKRSQQNGKRGRLLRKASGL